MKKFNPTKEMIQAAEAVLMAKAYVETIRPIVRAYQSKVLDIYRFTNKKELEIINKCGRMADHIKEEVITDPKDSWKLSDQDFQIYLRDTKEERDKAGLKVDKDDQCPLLVAEYLLCQAEGNLIDQMEPITKIKRDQLWNLKHRAKLIDLSLKLLTQFTNLK